MFVPDRSSCTLELFNCLMHLFVSCRLSVHGAVRVAVWSVHRLQHKWGGLLLLFSFIRPLCFSAQDCKKRYHLHPLVLPLKRSELWGVHFFFESAYASSPAVAGPLSSLLHQPLQSVVASTVLFSTISTQCIIIRIFVSNSQKIKQEK